MPTKVSSPKKKMRSLRMPPKKILNKFLKYINLDKKKTFAKLSS